MNEVLALPIRYITLARYSELTGKTTGALQKKIERGIWVEGKQYRRDEEGRVNWQYNKCGRWSPYPVPLAEEVRAIERASGEASK